MDKNSGGLKYHHEHAWAQVGKEELEAFSLLLGSSYGYSRIAFGKYGMSGEWETRKRENGFFFPIFFSFFKKAAGEN